MEGVDSAGEEVMWVNGPVRVRLATREHRFGAETGGASAATEREVADRWTMIILEGLWHQSAICIFKSK